MNPRVRPSPSSDVDDLDEATAAACYELPEYSRQLVAHFDGMDDEERAVHEALLARDRSQPLA